MGLSNNLRGALRWSAAEEAAVRISAVRNQVERTAAEGVTANGDAGVTEQLQKQLRHGMSELDAIRQFLHEGISNGNKQFVESGSKDAVLQHALEKGLVELETVRKRLVTVLRTTNTPQQATSSGTADEQRPPAPATATGKKATLSQKRPASATRRQTFPARPMSAKQPAHSSGGAAGGGESAYQSTSASLRATKIRPQSATTRSRVTNGATKPVSAGGGASSATAIPPSRPQPKSGWAETANNNTSTTASEGEHGPRSGRSEKETPAATRQQQPPPPSRPTGTKSRPSSAPNRARESVPATNVPPPSSPSNPDISPSPASGTTAWGKYQDWAQNVLNRVQNRRVQQQKQNFSGKVGGATGPAASGNAASTGVSAQGGAEANNNIGDNGSSSTTGLSRSATTGHIPRTTNVRPTSAKVGGGTNSAAANNNGSAAGSATSFLRRVNSTGGVQTRPASAHVGGGSQHSNAGAPQGLKLDAQAQALREQGNVLFQQKRYFDSADCYTKAIGIEPNSETLYCNRAAAFLMSSRFDEALNDSLRAIDIDPTHVKAHWRAAKAYLYLGNAEQAKHWYTAASKLAESPNDSDAINVELRTVDVVEKCRRCLRLREWTEAVRCADNILEVFPPSGPGSVTWQCLKAEALINTDAQEASQLLGKLAQDEPKNPEVWYLRAKSLFYMGHDAVSTNSSLGHIQRALECDPKHLKSTTLQAVVTTFAKLRDEGNTAYAGGRWQEAYVAYTKCLTVDSYNSSLKAIILCNRAAVCIQCERWKDAMDDINQSIGFNPQNAKAYARRARVHQHQNNHDASVKDLQLAVQMYPSAENQERLTQAIELRNQANRSRQQQQSEQSNKFKYFNFANGGGTGGGGTGGGGAQRPSTAGARRAQSGQSRPQSAQYGHKPNHGGYQQQHQQQQQPRHTGPTHYNVLGVDRRADERGLTKAYREAALKWHPDKWATGSDTEKAHAEHMFKEVSTAYGVLKDATKRRQYDLTI